NAPATGRRWPGPGSPCSTSRRSRACRRPASETQCARPTSPGPPQSSVGAPGAQRGGTLGYPTANIAMDPLLLCPRYGIYAGEALEHRAAISIGTNPHYGGTERRVEPRLLDFEGGLYGRGVSG